MKRYTPRSSVIDSADAGEMRIERRLVLVLGVSVAAGGIRLPNFDHGVGNRAAVFVEHAAGHDDSLAESVAAVEVRQVVFAVVRSEDPARGARSGDFRQRVFEPYRRMSRRSFVGARIGRMIVRRMNSRRLAPIAGGRISSRALFRHLLERGFCDSERGVRRGHSSIDRDLQQYFLYLVGSRARIASGANVQFEFFIMAAGRQQRYRDEAARSMIEAGPRPDITPCMARDEILKVFVES